MGPHATAMDPRSLVIAAALLAVAVLVAAAVRALRSVRAFGRTLNAAASSFSEPDCAEGCRRQHVHHARPIGD